MRAVVTNGSVLERDAGSLWKRELSLEQVSHEAERQVQCQAAVYT